MAAVSADVDEAAYEAAFVARQHDRHARDVANVDVARDLQVSRVRGEMPRPLVNALELQLEERRIAVPLGGQQISRVDTLVQAQRLTWRWRLHGMDVEGCGHGGSSRGEARSLARDVIDFNRGTRRRGLR